MKFAILLDYPMRTARSSKIRPFGHRQQWGVSPLESRIMLAGDMAAAVETSTAATGDCTVAIEAVTSASTSIVFIDSAVKKHEVLEGVIADSAEIVLIDNTRDAITQMTEHLALRRGIKSIHVVSHGGEGSLYLAGQQVDSAILQTKADLLKQWAKSLSANADILLYGCESGKADAGLDLIQKLANLTGADVAASDNRTGHTSLDADWVLERATGTIESLLVWDHQQLCEFTSYLGIQVAAAGSMGDEQFELEINGQVVRTFTATGTSAGSRQFSSYDYNVDGIAVNSIRINFVNDLYNPALGIDRNLRVDFIRVDGVTYQTEAPSVFSTGTWQPTDGLQPGNRQNEFLHANGYFQFSGSNANSGNLRVFARGQTGEEQLQLLVDGNTVQTVNNVSQSGDIFTFNVGNVSASSISIAFTNDLFDPARSFDRNLIVDAIELNGTRFETEASTTFSTGTWLSADGLQPGFRRSEILHTAGYFRYLADEANPGTSSGTIAISTGAISVNESAGSFTLDILRQGGSDGVVSVNYFTANDTAVAGLDYVAASGTVTFGSGEIRKTITIQVREDSNNEGTETFSVRLDNPTGAPLLAPRTTTVRILDNDSNLPTFTSFAGVSNLSLNGNAIISGGSLRLTAATPQQRGSSYFVTPIAINDSTSFQTFFTARFTGGQGSLGGEGLAFVIQNSPAGTAAQNIGNFSGGLNYNAVSKSIAVELDTFRNVYEQNAGEITIVANGTPVTPLANIAAPFDLNNGSTQYVWVDYNGDSNVLAVFLSDRDVKPDFAVLKTTVDLARTVGNQAYLGFAAATGTAFNNTFVDSWNFTFDKPDSDPPIFPTGTPVEVNLASGLDKPVTLKFADNGRNLYITEQKGVLKVIRDGGNVQTVMDISDRVNSFQDRGLIGLEVDPNFQINGYIYLAYTYDPPQVFNNVGNAFAGPDGQGNRAAQVIRVTADARTGFTTIVGGSERLLLGSQSTWNNFNGFIDSTLNISAPQGGVNPDGTYINDFINSDSRSHTIGSLAFAPDGSLFVSTGDGASFNQTDPRAFRVQDPNSLAGKILRIDPSTGRGLSDNPFYNGNPNDNRSKVYQLGLRNPWRLVVDDVTGRLYIGETGLTSFEEINTGSAGANFGWPAYEGGQGVNRRTPSYQNLGLSQAVYNNVQATPAFIALQHGTGFNVIVAGDIGRNLAYGPQYDGDLFYNDFGRGIVRHADIAPDGTLLGAQVFATGANFINDIEQGEDGLLYYANLIEGTVGRWEIV